MEVAIFGGGISGLTVAHSLLKAGARVTLYEADSRLGGHAKSGWAGGAPSEVSWRGYGPFYANTFEVMRGIPRPGGGTVYDNLSLPLRFLHPRDQSRGVARPRPRPTFLDNARAAYRIAQALAADERPFDTLNYREVMEPGLSRDGRDAYIHTIGPYTGQDIDQTTMHHLARFARLQGSSAYPHYHPPASVGEIEKPGYLHRSRFAPWHLMNLPTSMAWFDPWAAYLEAQGARIVLNAELLRVEAADGRVARCRVVVDGEEREVRADAYVVALDPYGAAALVARSPSLPRGGGTQFDRLVEIAAKPPHVQIGFPMTLTEGGGPPLPPPVGRTFPDSEFNVTAFPLEQFYPRELTGGRRIWSGTACLCDRPGRLFGLPARALTEAQFQAEVAHQVSRSPELGLAASDIATIRPWEDWTFPPEEGGEVRTRRPKWVNGPGEALPAQATELPNLVLAGAHTTTSTGFFSMEAAVESGKRAAALLAPQGAVPLAEHAPGPLVKALSRADNHLYRAGLPSVIPCTLGVFGLLVIVLVLLLAWGVARAARGAGRKRGPPQGARANPERAMGESR